jgi:HlyD family secretion protein
LTALEQPQKTRLAAQQSEVQNHRTMAALKHRDLAALTVRAGMRGVLQDVVVDVGQRVTRGANLARVIDPSRLKARIRVPEAQTTALQPGQTVSIDTHNGIVPGRISRISPSAENGTVAVDVRLDEALPTGARADMTIDGTIHLDRLANIRHVSRPASGSAEGDVFLFKVSADGSRAERISVRLGSATTNRVQIVDGDLRAGDRVVLSDTSAWPDAAVVRLR